MALAAFLIGTQSAFKEGLGLTKGLDRHDYRVVDSCVRLSVSLSAEGQP